MKKLIIFAVLPLAMMASGCKTLGISAAGVVAQTVQDNSTASPGQATTLIEAEQAATLATQAADLYVHTGNPSGDQLNKIGALSDGVHAALVSLEDANASGKALSFSTFNAAVKAFNAYIAANKGQ